MSINKKYEKKIDATRAFVKNLVGKGLDSFLATEYSDEKGALFRNLLSGELSDEEAEAVKEKLDLYHLRDRRTPVQYAVDLVLGWVIEDALINFIEEETSLTPKRASADRQREFLPRKEIEATPDLFFEDQRGKEVYIEVATDYTGFWAREDKCHLRDEKYTRVKEEDGLLLGIDTENEQFFIFPVEEVPVTYIKSHYPYGGKPAYEIDLESVEFHRFSQLREVLATKFTT